MWTQNVIHYLRAFPVTDTPVTGEESVFGALRSQLQRMEPLRLIWWLLVLVITASTFARFTEDSSWLVHSLLVIAGSGGCAWVWFLSRLLFRSKADITAGAIVLVPVVMGVEAAAHLISPLSGGIVGAETARVVTNASSFICITAIAFTFSEPLQGLANIRSTNERRFRLAFVTCVSLLVVLTILWVAGAATDSFAAQWRTHILTVCGVFALVGSRLAVEYRLKHPLSGKKAAPTTATPIKDDSMELAKRIQEALNDDALLTTPNLKVAEFAERINEQEYKVTRCLTGQLQYRNFNQFLNHHRVERAKRLLVAPNHAHQSISTIAFDCGYNSIGPFNRAFKELTGFTPKAYRDSQSRSASV
ncbi:AraC family transcriptional regulator [uncultured Umboniibacter sp.]|uniref:helix-turn-helix domain-containing protein n=1 Tax=uncultured Umboniibacter sp. TaxID=1798917 RepID=UPI002637B97D|nr:AraC family transcriptional regulator [uncultured Umboniibacter sp.]